jgi:hypothetical protein
MSSRVVVQSVSGIVALVLSFVGTKKKPPAIQEPSSPAH